MLSIYISVYMNVLVCTREHACVGVGVFVGKHETSVQEKFITKPERTGRRGESSRPILFKRMCAYCLFSRFSMQSVYEISGERLEHV